MEKSHFRFSFMKDIKTYNWNIESYMKSKSFLYPLKFFASSDDQHDHHPEKLIEQ